MGLNEDGFCRDGQPPPGGHLVRARLAVCEVVAVEAKWRLTLLQVMSTQVLDHPAMYLGEQLCP